MDTPARPTLGRTLGRTFGRSVGHVVAGTLGRTADWLLPRRCALCDWACTGGPLCHDCDASLAGRSIARCVRCAIGLGAAAGPVCAGCRRDPPPLDQVVALADYAPPLQEAILALKFGAQVGLARPLGEWLAGDVPVDLAVEAVVPIPLSHRRLAERGFNQSQLMASALCRHWPASASASSSSSSSSSSSTATRPVLRPGWLARRRDTVPQTGLGRAQRRDNVAGAFAAAPAVAGRRIALVDDIMTSGATLAAAAEALREAGAATVVALVIARTTTVHSPAACSTSSSSTPRSRPTPAT